MTLLVAYVTLSVDERIKILRFLSLLVRLFCIILCLIGLLRIIDAHSLLTPTGLIVKLLVTSVIFKIDESLLVWSPFYLPCVEDPPRFSDQYLL